MVYRDSPQNRLPGIPSSQDPFRGTGTYLIAITFSKVAPARDSRSNISSSLTRSDSLTPNQIRSIVWFKGFHSFFQSTRCRFCFLKNILEFWHDSEWSYDIFLTCLLGDESCFCSNCFKYEDFRSDNLPILIGWFSKFSGSWALLAGVGKLEYFWSRSWIDPTSGNGLWMFVKVFQPWIWRTPSEDLGPWLGFPDFGDRNLLLVGVL